MHADKAHPYMKGGTPWLQLSILIPTALPPLRLPLRQPLDFHLQNR